MRIIGLFGRGQCGKSETLGVYLRSLVHGDPLANAEEKYGQQKDQRELIELDGKDVVICPPSDTKDIVLTNIDFIKKHPCDIVFTATRTKGWGREALEAYARSVKAELSWIKKEYNDDLNKNGQKNANLKQAKSLFDMI